MVTQASGQAISFWHTQSPDNSANFNRAVTKKQKLEIVNRLEELRATVNDEKTGKPISERGFSNYCGLSSPSHYSTMLNAFRRGDGDNTSIAKLIAIADKMVVSLDWLLRGIGAPGFDDATTTDPIYPTRTPALHVHRLMKTDPVALAEVAAISHLTKDPGFQHWLDEIRVHQERNRQASR